MPFCLHGYPERTCPICELQIELAAAQFELEQQRAARARAERALRVATEDYNASLKALAEGLRAGQRSSEERATQAEAQRDEALRLQSPDTPLQRWGIKYQGPRDPHCLPMDDGYWTPWHIAAAKLEQAEARASGVLGFAGRILREHREHGYSDIERGDVEEWAMKYGLLAERTVTEPCGDDCSCAEVGFPATCLFATDTGLDAIRAALAASNEARGEGAQ